MTDCPFLKACRKIRPVPLIPELCEKEEIRHHCHDYQFAVLVNNQAITKATIRCEDFKRPQMGYQLGKLLMEVP
jgi:hypothetical protein